MLTEEILEERRRYNREYMRQWRSNPENRRRECTNRTRWDLQRKLQGAAADKASRPHTNGRGKPVCGFCHIRPPVRRVARLRILASGEFKSVRIPYCGQC